MTRKIRAIIPVRAGSQRVKNKNIRNFAGSSLLAIKIEQLKRIPVIEDIVVNSDSSEMLEIAMELGVTPQKRDPHFASSEIPANLFWENLAEQNYDCDDILYTNCTNPLVKDESYVKAIEIYNKLSEDLDSLTTVTEITEYLWDGNTAINYDPENHPRSQDLKSYHALNFAISIIPRELMKIRKSILGNNFFQLKLSGLESTDIDTLEDFSLAEVLYERNVL